MATKTKAPKTKGSRMKGDITMFTKYETDGGLLFEVVPKTVKGLVGYHIMRGKKSLARFASPAEAAGALLGYGTAESARESLGRIERKVELILALVNKSDPLMKEFSLVIEDLDSITEQLDGIADAISQGKI